ncbi:MAG: YHS domain-containing (seleno)protein [Crocosphaera sp.]|nr:YHS domain-containing (seleno)protein [Crocosphaera sp.]
MKLKKIDVLKNLMLISVVSLTGLTVGCQTITTNESSQENSSSTNQVKSENSTKTIFFEQQGVAIKGTDPVAYFVDGQAVKGNSEFSHQWAGTTWWFKSAEHRDLFVKEPEKYAPQYGGFCAWAVSNNYTAPIDPEAWKIVDGKLYLNYDANIQKRWNKNIPNNIVKADANWPKLANKITN